MPPRLKNTYPTEDVKLDNDSIIYWSRRLERSGHVPVTCGACGLEHTPAAKEAIKPSFTGFHGECYRASLGPRGDEPIGKHGSIMHHEQPDPTNLRKRAVTCGGPCGGNIYYIYPKKIGDRKKMKGLCPSCKRRKFIGRRELRKGSWVDFDDRVRVTRPSGPGYFKIALECRGCFAERQVKYYVQFGMVRAYMEGKNKKDWDELCDVCMAERRSLNRLTGTLYGTGERPTEFHLPPRQF